MITEAPTISVCIPTRNQAAFLPDALRSLFVQTRGDFEIIVFDDASTDDTAGILAGCADARLQCYRHPKPVGVAENRNACLRVARGAYIAWLDSDDVYHPDMLARQAAVLERNPNVGLVHGAFELIDAAGRLLPPWPVPFASDTIESSDAAFRELILSNYITTCTVLVRRECHDRAGPFVSSIGASSTDWDMWLRVALLADVAYTHRLLARYRQHERSISTRTSRSGQRLRCDEQVVRHVFAVGGCHITDAHGLRRNARAALAVKWLQHCGDLALLGKRRAAVSAALRAFKLMPSRLRRSHAMPLVRSILRHDEYAHHEHAKTLLHQLYLQLEGTRFAASIRKFAVPNDRWQATLSRIANVVQRVVPVDAMIATVDKYDPTLLHLCGRHGLHFPERSSFPGGYPSTGAEVVAHLRELHQRGVRYLVLPNAAFWWLEYYPELADFVAADQLIWSDEDCQIFDLCRTEAGRQMGVSEHDSLCNLTSS